MSLKSLLKFRATVAFRLAAGYTAVIAVSLVIIFVLFYSFLKADLATRTNSYFVDKAREFSALVATRGPQAMRGEFGREAESVGTRQIFFRLIDGNGRIVAASSDAAFQGVGVDMKAVKEVERGRPVAFTVSVKGRPYHVRDFYARLAPDLVLQVGKYMGADEDLLEDLRQSFWVALICVLAVSGFIGWFMSKRALAGVEEVTRTARAISSGDLERRVPVTGRGDEIDRLATTFNDMLGRIQTMVSEMRQITDNIAHDLKSPITRIRGLSEMALTSRTGPRDFEATASSTVEECDRLLGMINAMLDISEAEAGVADMKLERLDLGKILLEACELFQPMAEERGLSLAVEAAPGCSIRGDRHKIQRTVANLVDNAVKYTRPGGKVAVSLEVSGSRAFVRVQDSGIGISPGDLQRIFDRFYRADRSRTEEGNGLGLSLARANARAHGGDVSAQSDPGRGSTFTLTLPLAPATNKGG
ncbi:MAG: ATP-binding protein [Acidobacteriota bacterium]